jgi:CTP:molybdopterin cytidylyltransferase MocA
MGAFKPLLPFGEETVIESCIRSFREADVSDLVVVVGFRGDEIRQFLRDAGVRFATNPDPDSAMAASIASGVTELTPAAQAILITPVDHPAAGAETIKAITDQWRSGARLVQPEYEGRGGHPILIDAHFRRELLNLDPEKGLRGFFAAHADEVLRLPVACPYIARDMDTWEDYLALHREVLGRPPRKI